MCEYSRHGVVDGVCGPVADIRQICLLDRANNLLHESLFRSSQLTEQAHFLGVHNPHIGVRMGGRSVRNDERTQVSRVDESIGIYEFVLRLSNHYAEVDMCSYSKI